MIFITSPRFGVGSFSFASLISGVTASFTTQAELDQVCACVVVLCVYASFQEKNSSQCPSS